MKTVQPTKPEVFTIWLFTEKINVGYNSKWGFKYKPSFAYGQRNTYFKNPQINIIDILVIKEWYMINIENVGTMEKHNKRVKVSCNLQFRNNLLKL